MIEKAKALVLYAIDLNLLNREMSKYINKPLSITVSLIDGETKCIMIVHDEDVDDVDIIHIA